MAGNIKGITIEINGETSGLNNALKSVNREVNTTKRELKEVEKALKLDPKNTELVAQKEKLLNKELEDQKTKLDALKKAKEEADKKMKDGGEVNQEEYRKLTREIVKTEDAVKSLEKETSGFAKTTEKIGNAGEKMEAFGKKALVVSAAIVSIGAAAVKSFNELDEGWDTIAVKTGATGTVLEGLQDSMNNVFGKLPMEAEAIGSAIGEVNTRFKVTGKELESVSESFLKFAEINGTDVSRSVGDVHKLMQAWNIDISKTDNVLGLLTKSAQESGISIDALISSVKSNNATFKQMGLTFEQAVSLMARFEENGVEASTALMGLKKAAVSFSKDGKSMTDGLNGTIEAIKTAKTETEALEIASEIFGTRGAVEMTSAIREGRFSIDELNSSMEEMGNVVNDTFEATQDPPDKLKVAFNNLKIAGADLGNSILQAVTPAIDGLVGMLKGAVEWFGGLSDGTKSLIVAIGGLIAVVPVLTTLLGVMMTTIEAHPIIALATAIVGVSTALIGWIGSQRTEIDLINDEIKATKESTEAFKERKTQMESDAKTEGAKTERLRELKNELLNLVDANGECKDSDKVRVDFIKGELESALGREIQQNELVGDSIKQLSGEIDNLIEKQKAQIYLQQEQSLYEEAVKNRTSQASAVASQSSAVASASRAYDRASLTGEGQEDAFKRLQAESEKLKELENALAESNAVIHQYEEDTALVIEGKTKEFCDNFEKRSAATIEYTESSKTEFGEMSIAAAQGFDELFSAAQEGGKKVDDLVLADSAKTLQDAVQQYTAVGQAVPSGMVDGINSLISYLEETGQAVPQDLYDAVASSNESQDWIGEGGVAPKKFTEGATIQAAYEQTSLVDVGLMLVRGIVSGLKSGQFDLIGGAQWVISTLLNSIRSRAQIKSPSRLFRDEVGVHISQGIAEGIEEDDTPEKVAEKKIANILKIAKNSISDLGVWEKTAELEFGQWNLNTPNASDAEKAQKESAVYSKQADVYSQKAGAKQAELEALISNGASTTQIQNARNELLEYGNKELELRGKATSVMNKYASRQNEIATNADSFRSVFSSLIYSGEADFYRSHGLTESQIDEWALNKSGAKEYAEKEGISITQIFNAKHMTPSEVAQETASTLKREAILGYGY